MSRTYAPNLVSLETLAFRLDCSTGEIERLMRSGALPAPVMIGDLMRWDFEGVLAFVARATADLHGRSRGAPEVGEQRVAWSGCRSVPLWG